MSDEASPWAASPTTAKRWLGRQMRARREAAGLEVKDAADALRSTMAKAAYTEAGTHAFKPRDLEQALFPLYDVPEGDWPLLLAACRRSRERGWWQAYDDEVVPDALRHYIGLEQGATTLRSWESLVPHPLLQAEAYAHALVAGKWARLTDDDIAARVEVRLQRQRALTRAQGPLEAHFVLDEAILRRVGCGPAAMAAQLDRLVAVAGRPNVTLQVVPFAHGPHPDAPASATLLGFGDDDPGLAYLEGRCRRCEYVDDPNEVADIGVVFGQLAELALPPDDSVDYIRQVAAAAARQAPGGGAARAGD